MLTFQRGKHAFDSSTSHDARCLLKVISTRLCMLIVVIEPAAVAPAVEKMRAFEASTKQTVNENGGRWRVGGLVVGTGGLHNTNSFTPPLR
jgi:hypothetical protein